MPDEWGVTQELTVPAEHEPFGFDDRALSLNLAFGLGTPMGFAGGVVEYSPLPGLAVGVGAGANLEGLQLAALTRVRPLLWETPNNVYAIALGVAVATGPYSSDDSLSGSAPGLDAAKAQYAWLDHAWWLQPELQFEFGSRGGLHLVVTGVGLAFLLNPDAAQCKTRPAKPGVTYEPGGCSMERVIGTFTIELGYAFR